MSSYTALYRKFRPTTFADVKGQDHIVTTLRNQLKANRIGHAYLFTGTRGTGKTTVAKIFARAVNCQSPTEDGPCGECAICKSIAAGNSMNVIEMDAASNNGVDSIREIIDEVSYRPTEGRFKVYIIDEVHMLSPGAFNAMLKTLEEPPEYVIFILATTEVHKLPITVLSRCQRYDFRRISIDTIAGRMTDLMEQEGHQVEDRAIRYVAKLADGSMRDGLSLLDRCLAFNFGVELTYERALEVLGAVDTEVFSNLFRSVIKSDVIGCIRTLDEVITQGRELTQFVNDFVWYMRNLMLVQAADGLEDVIDMSADNMARLKEESELVGRDQVVRYIREFSELSNQLRFATQKRILTEVALIRLCKPQMNQDSEAILGRVRALEDAVENGVVAAAPVTGHLSETSQVPRVTKPSLPAAVPDDVARIVSQWSTVMGQLDPPMQGAMATAKPSLGADGRLEIVFNHGDIAVDRLKEPGREEVLAQVLSDITGKEVSFKIRETTSEPEFDIGTLDLRDVIKLDITEEDE